MLLVATGPGTFEIQRRPDMLFLFDLARPGLDRIMASLH